MPLCQLQRLYIGKIGNGDFKMMEEAMLACLKALARRNWGEPQKAVRISSVSAKIQAKDLPDTKQNC
jgi:hypothetical protein